MDMKNNWDSPYQPEDLQSAVTLIFLDFVDDIALLLDKIDQAQGILARVQRACQKAGLVLNAKKTKYINVQHSYKGDCSKNK